MSEVGGLLPVMTTTTHPAGPALVPTPGQAPLFDPPAGRLTRAQHEDLFGHLPWRDAQALHVPEVAAVVRPLLARGWRPAQLAARVGALPATAGPDATLAAVVAFLQVLLERDSPAAEHAAAKQARDQERHDRQAGEQPVASDEVKAHWVAHARRSLGLPPRPRSVQAAPAAPVCASCPGEGSFFVTREVRLCGACVELLRTGRAHLALGA